MLDVLALENLLEAERREAPAEVLALLATPASAPGPSATTPRPTGSGTSSRARGWEVRDGPDGPELLPLHVIVYGRNPVREALRGPRAV